MGRGFAVILAGVGVWLLLAYRSLSGLWLIAVAFLLGQSARGALMQTTLTERIEGLRIPPSCSSACHAPTMARPRKP